MILNSEGNVKTMVRKTFEPSYSEFEDSLCDGAQLTFVNSQHKSEQREHISQSINSSSATSNDYYEDTHCIPEDQDRYPCHSSHSSNANSINNPNHPNISAHENLEHQSFDQLLLDRHSYNQELLQQIHQCKYVIESYEQWLQWLIHCFHYNFNEMQQAYITNNISAYSRTSNLRTEEYAAYLLDNVAHEANIEEKNKEAVPIKNSKYLCWEGVLPKRKRKSGDKGVVVYSRKVFIGGVPWDVTEDQLKKAFGEFGNFFVQWPTRESTSSSQVRIKGYLYLIFDHESNVESMINQIRSSGQESNGGSVTFNYRIQCNRNKHVQIVPWLASDNYLEVPSSTPQSDLRTVFVGGLHGKLYAQALFDIFDSLFGGVVSVKIDTDEYNYPTGSGSVTFSSMKSYIKAITANYVEVKTSTFGPKLIEIQHFMEDKICSMCDVMPGKKFCKSECFDYFCELCWKKHHTPNTNHKSVTRFHKGNQIDSSS